MNPSTITFIAICSSLLHALAYLIYVRSALRGKVKPNPTSWLMWTYGTALLVIVEWDQEAAFSVMLLPMVCAACSLIVAGCCWQKGRLTWPETPSDRKAFLLDLFFTGVYVFLIVMELRGRLTLADETLYKSMLLILLSGSTFVSFWPILRTTRETPENEHWLAWAIWTLAYACLLLITIAEHGSSLQSIQFWAYPASCLIPTGMVGFYAFQQRDASTLIPEVVEKPQ